MPGRQSHGAAPSKKAKGGSQKSKARNNAKKRSLNAFSIASHEVPENIKIRKHRLGEQEGGNRPGKRRREEDEEEEEDGEEGGPKKQRKGPVKGRFDELDVDRGSDSEGNEWMMGQVASDDDSDLDSDEAFGESDEERFQGYAFSGSANKKSKKNSTTRNKEVNLDEDEGSESDSELEEGDLGEDAVDLATMLDMVEAEEEEERRARIKKKAQAGSDSEDEMMAEDDKMAQDDSEEEDEEEGDSESGESSASSLDIDEDDDGSLDPAKIAAVGEMIGKMHQDDEASQPATRQSAAEPTPMSKLTMDDLIGSLDSKPLKAIEADSKRAKRKTAAAQLSIPLAKRQQDRLDRGAAYEKSKETLDRWTDTVKHNRRADHLMFPLPDPEADSAKRNDKLIPTNQTRPFNELEATIQSILEESGLATANGKDDEDHIREFEELEAKKMSLEEVKARRDQLRMARDLMFREEAKAKRIKKIKSKSYRRVHRKQREREDQKLREAREAEGFEPSEDELEAQDRRRATERMGAKHRGSKWAKATKQIGRAAWDEDARDGITEMARRDEELRKRVEGRAVRKEFEDNSDSSFSDSEEDFSGDDEEGSNRLTRQLNKVTGSELVDESAPGGKLANMKFMLKADAARKKQNDEMVESIRRDLAGEDSESESEAEFIGRKTFGPNTTKEPTNLKPSKLNEFEEHEGSDAEAENMDVEFLGFDNDPKLASKAQPSGKAQSKKSSLTIPKPQPETLTGRGAWSKPASQSTGVSAGEAARRTHKRNAAIQLSPSPPPSALPPLPKSTSKPRSKPSNTLTALEIDPPSSDSDSAPPQPSPSPSAPTTAPSYPAPSPAQTSSQISKPRNGPR